MTRLAYDPERVEELWRHTRRAVDDLAEIRCDDPAAVEAMRIVRLAQLHLETDWMPVLERIRANTALIAPIVAGFSDEEREFFQGFVNEAAASVAMELSHYDAHLDYQLDVLPEELRTLDDRREWDWLARLYLIEQYHEMIDTGAVEVQRDGEHYWIDPVELTDTNGVVMGEIILAGVAAAGRFSKATSGGLSTAGARTASSPMPASRPVVAPTSITGYTKHGLERVMNKDGVGVSPAAVRDAVRYPTLVEYQAKKTPTTTSAATRRVVLDQAGLLVTAWRLLEAGWRGPR